MAQNSIRDNIAKIQLLLDADFHHETPIVVVEGIDDIVFFNGKFKSKVDLKESYSGKVGVYEIVHHFSDNRVVGICDRDYDDICDENRIFYYDYSCLEMMLVSNDEAFRNFFYTYYFGKLHPDDMRILILSDLKWISIYRKLNANRKWGIRFSGISIGNAYNEQQEKLDYSIILSQLKRINPDLIDYEHEQLRLVSNQYRVSIDYDTYLEITNGHDFFYYFHRICCHHNPVKSSSYSEMKKGLICSYRLDDFKTSNLYSSLFRYQQETDVLFFD